MFGIFNRMYFKNRKNKISLKQLKNQQRDKEIENNKGKTRSSINESI